MQFLRPSSASSVRRRVAVAQSRLSSVFADGNDVFPLEDIGVAPVRYVSTKNPPSGCGMSPSSVIIASFSSLAARAALDDEDEDDEDVAIRSQALRAILSSALDRVATIVAHAPIVNPIASARRCSDVVIFRRCSPTCLWLSRRRVAVRGITLFKKTKISPVTNPSHEDAR